MRSLEKSSLVISVLSLAVLAVLAPARPRAATGDVLPFKSADEVIERGNRTSYGLAAAVWTKDISKAHRIANSLRAGTVWVGRRGCTWERDWGWWPCWRYGS